MKFSPLWHSLPSLLSLSSFFLSRSLFLTLALSLSFDRLRLEIACQLVSTQPSWVSPPHPPYASCWRDQVCVCACSNAFQLCFLPHPSLPSLTPALSCFFTHSLTH